MFKNKNRPNSQPRTPEEIQQDYYRVSAQLGELEYNYRTIPDRQDECIAKIKELDSEMNQARLKAQEAVKQAQAAAAKAKETPDADRSKQTA